MLKQGIRDLVARMGDALEPFRQHIDNLMTIPGISDVSAHVIAGEVGLDMTRFPSASNLRASTARRGFAKAPRG